MCLKFTGGGGGEEGIAVMWVTWFFHKNIL